MDLKKEFKDGVRINTKNYYSIKDIVAGDFADMFPCSNNASALRMFKHTLANQLKQGFITSVDDYELFYIGKAITYSDGHLEFFTNISRVIDNETNNEEDMEVIINNV